MEDFSLELKARCLQIEFIDAFCFFSAIDHRKDFSSRIYRRNKRIDRATISLNTTTRFTKFPLKIP